MKAAIPYPSADDVETADRDTLRWWLNELPGDGGDDAKWKLMQRIIDRLQVFNRDPYKPARSERAKPLQPAAKPKPKPAAKPAPEPVAPGYFKSLFS